ncbi:LLM class flavin-dependent oxidoreductase [Streptomyces sp. NPDC054837]
MRDDQAGARTAAVGDRGGVPDGGRGTLASIDLLSGGRLTVTVGAGFPGRFGPPLCTLSELPWEQRFARPDETVALWRALWDGADSFHGEILRFEDIPPTIKPSRAGGPPIRLGGATPAALARTSRMYDGWLPYPPDPADYASGLHHVRKAAADTGRAAENITALFVTVRTDDDNDSGRRAHPGAVPPSGLGGRRLRLPQGERRLRRPAQRLHRMPQRAP